MFRLAIIYKFSVVFLLFVALCFLGFSGFKFINADYELAMWHRAFGFSLLAAVVLHIIINYKKLVKLLNEAADVLLNRANPTYCNMDRLISTFKPYTITSLALELGLDPDTLFATLKNAGINIRSKDQSIASISKLNHEKLFYTIVVIIETRLKGKAPKWQESKNSVFIDR